MGEKKNGDAYGEKEAQDRFEAALRGALKTPHEPLKGRTKMKKPVKKTKKRDQRVG